MPNIHQYPATRNVDMSQTLYILGKTLTVEKIVEIPPKTQTSGL